MRAWQINILIVLGVIGLAFIPETIIPDKFYEPLILSIVIGTSWWAYDEAKKLQTEKYARTWISPFTSPFGIAAYCILLWIVGFPMFIVFREKILEGKMPQKPDQAD